MEIESLKKNSKCEIRFAPKFDYSKNPLMEIENFYKEEKDFKNLYKPCTFPCSDTFITPEGLVYPCLSVKMGDLKEQSLNEVYSSEKYKSFRISPGCGGLNIFIKYSFLVIILIINNKNIL